ncbi:uncharacterized protein LOC106460795 [Limulus polyphemus]|uniref:Uncharacterized protein LOC106460795 n=1 Tax=Limulus polyphemus TaxID=6850 RepID=A0ABM1SYA8_LIMPO|nr:uncharacterized protein LOC106460795 [Limulus polyphemus]
MAIPAPVYFLIKEHAKSLVAIKELQDRLTAAEHFQTNAITLFQDIEQQLVQRDYKYRCLSDRKYPYNKLLHQFPFPQPTNLVSECPKSSSGRLGSSYSSSLHLSASNSSTRHAESKRKLIMESDNKQDSGLDSDCRDQGQGSSLTFVSNPSNFAMCERKEQIQKESCMCMFGAGDELSTLLDVINQKGLLLRKQIDVMNQQHDIKGENYLASYEQDFISRHQTVQNVEIKLKQVEKERSDLFNKVVHLEAACHELEKEKKWLEERLETILLEKEQLEYHIHGLYLQYVKNQGNEAEQWKEGKLTENISQPKISQPRNEAASSSLQPTLSCQNKVSSVFKESDPSLQATLSCQNKVSSVLKESDILKLQQQLITYVLENEILQTKIQHLEEIHKTSNVIVENKLTVQLKQLQSEKEELCLMLQANKLELESMHAKVFMLKKDLCSLIRENQELKRQIGKSSKQTSAYHSKYQQLHEPTLVMNSERSSPDTYSLPPFLPLETIYANPVLNNYVQNKYSENDKSSFLNLTCPETQSENIRHYDIITSTQHGESSSSHHSLDFESPSHCRQSRHDFTLLPMNNSPHSSPALDVLSCSSFTQNKPSETCQVSTVIEKQGSLSQSETSSPVFQFKNIHNTKSLSYNKDALEKLERNTQSKHMDSICSEFDPLHTTFHRDPLRQMEFVDSLDLSVPLNPEKTHQSRRRDLPFPRSAASYLSQQKLSASQDTRLDFGFRKQHGSQKIAFQTAREKNSKNLQYHLQNLLDRISATVSGEPLL